jgi:hypothetical protein
MKLSALKSIAIILAKIAPGIRQRTATILWVFITLVLSEYQLLQRQKISESQVNKFIILLCTL